jgi:hypothetical protein
MNAIIRKHDTIINNSKTKWKHVYLRTCRLFEKECSIISNSVLLLSHPSRKFTSSGIKHHFQTHNSSAVRSALGLLNLHNNTDFTARQLRDAYFLAAKKCHPDTSNIEIIAGSNDENDTLKAQKIRKELTSIFLQITDAYELLQKHCKNQPSSSSSASSENHKTRSSTNTEFDNEVEFFSLTEEEDYRQACLDHLGLDADIVEESKKCPLFRQWLQGNTDSAAIWGNFLMLHGGLAPMIKNDGKKVLHVTEGDGHYYSREGSSSTGGNRKRRRRRT